MPGERWKISENPRLTAEHVRAAFRYDPDTGVMYRLSTGRAVGTLDKKGYLRTMVFGSLVFVHRLVWMHVNGRWPLEQIDHINMNGADNRLCNLREVTDSQNSCNRKVRPESASGVKGVYKDSRCKSWIAWITFEGKITKKRFATKAEAVAARKAMSAIHGLYAREGDE